MSLYPNYRPVGIRKDWDHTSVSNDDAHMVLRRHGGRDERPVDAVAWWDDDGQLRRLIADYSDGRRADLRVNGRGYRLSHTSPARASDAQPSASPSHPGCIEAAARATGSET